MKKHPMLADMRGVRPYALADADALYAVRPAAQQIEGFLPVGGVMGITAYPGVGKSWLAMEISRAVASGTPFLGRYRAHRGGVLFVGSDSSLEDYALQWSRLTRSIDGASEVFEPARFLVQSSFMFEDRDEVRRLIRTHETFEWGDVQHEAGTNLAYREQGFHVIVFDTLSKLTRANQNDNSEMEEVFRNVRLIADATNAAVVLLHHNSKRSEYNDGSDWRGAMSQIGGLDSWVHLTPARSDKYLIGVTYKKFRGITPPDFSYRMDVEDPSRAALTATDEPVTREQRMERGHLARAVEKYVAEHPGQRAVEIKKGMWDEHQGDHGGEKFTSKKPFDTAVDNRLARLSKAGAVVKSQSDEGKTVYHAGAGGGKA